MAFQYAHHRPMTPITPIHSPHPSGGSSIRARTLGQLSLHEYRKMQVTPSPPAIPGQKTVKKKRGLSSLSRNAGTPTVSCNENFFSSFQSLTTPPETPSLGLPLDFTSDVLHVDGTNGAHVAHASVDSSYPEFAHLLSPGSEISPPNSPPNPFLPYSTSRNSVLERLIGGEKRSLSRPWTQAWGQGQRYVSLHSENTRPKSEQPAQRVNWARTTPVPAKQGTSASSGRSGLEDSHPTHPPDWKGRRPPRPQSRREGVHPNVELIESPQQPAFETPLASFRHFSVPAEKNPRKSSRQAETSQFRERHFNTIKRLPRPSDATKRRPAPLRLTASNGEGLYSSEHNTASTSTFSLSKYPFPNPPETPAEFVESDPLLCYAQGQRSHEIAHLSAKSPSVRFSGVSFEIVNPHYSFGHLTSESTEDSMSNNGDGPPRARHHSTLPAAFAAVTGSSSRESSTAQDVPTTPSLRSTSARSHPDWRFTPDGARVSPEGEQLTAAYAAGPSASQGAIDRLSQGTSRLPNPQILTYGQRSATASHSIPGRMPRVSEPSPPDSPGYITAPLHSTRSLDSARVTAHAESRGHALHFSESSDLPALPTAGTSHFAHESFNTADSVPTSLPALTSSSTITSGVGSIPYPGAQVPPRTEHQPSDNDDDDDLYSPPSPIGARRHIPRPENVPPAVAATPQAVQPHADHRVSEPFPFAGYMDDTPAREDSTVGRIVDQYYQDTSARASDDDDRNPFVDDDGSDYSNNDELPGPSNHQIAYPPPLRLTGHQQRTQLPLGALPPPGTVAVHQGNGHSYGDDTAPSARVPLWRRYQLRHGESLRSVPVNEMETREDLDEIILDMRMQPLLQPRETPFWDRYEAILDRVESLFGAEARVIARNDMNRSMPDSTPSDRQINPAQDRPPNTGVATTAPSSTSVAADLSTYDPQYGGSGASVIRSPVSQPIPPMPFDPYYPSDEDDIDESMSAVSPSSPLDTSPHPGFEHYQGPMRRQVPFTLDHLPQLPGPPPSAPLPSVPAEDRMMAPLPAVPALFTRGDPAEYSQGSTYGETHDLLNLASPTRPATRRANHGRSLTAGLPAIDTSHSGRLRGVPPMWVGSSPPPTMRHQSHRTPSAEGPSHHETTNAVLDGANDDDEWETEPGGSRRTSAMPEAYTHQETALRPTGSNLPGFYPLDDLSAEPHDDYEARPVFEPPRVVQRPGQAIADIELGLVHTASRRTLHSSDPRGPPPSRVRGRTNSTTITTFPSGRPLRSPTTLSSMRTIRAGARMPSVTGQTSTTALILDPVRVRVNAGEPMLISRPDSLSDRHKLIIDVAYWSSVTVLSPFVLPPLCLGFGMVDSWLHDRMSHKMKNLALMIGVLWAIVWCTAITIGVTLYVSRTD